MRKRVGVSMRFLVCLLGLYAICVNAAPLNFPQAKKIAGRLFEKHAQTIYCQCTYVNKEVQLASCNMSAAEAIKRAHRIEWEHIMAAEHFGKTFECWNKPLCERHGVRYKGRACCEKIDSAFRQMESELYNLWPEVGLVNQVRSNYRFVASLQTQGYYGCGIKVDKALHQVEPPDVAKGVVARAYLFMSSFYSIPLEPGELELFSQWNAAYPPSAWELSWAKDVASIEGYENPYITSTN